MTTQNKKPKKFEKLKYKYRFVILNDETFEEKFNFRLSRLNVYTALGVGSLLLIALVTVLIAFTPLREFIPGYTDVTIRKTGIENTLKLDSLENVLRQKEQYLDNINRIIQGEPLIYNDTVVVDSNLNYKNIVNEKIPEDSLLRVMIETEEKYNLFKSAGRTPSSISSLIFFNPIKGIITEQFNARKQHFGVDLVAPKNEVIKATLDGTVIFAEWTSETGYVIQLQHSNNLISIYKHNSVLHKKQGDKVKAGDVIAIVGNTGELSSGPHLHFELWYNGIPLNPEEYMKCTNSCNIHTSN
jgi:murein DD-endopeptidase MepM/ murein hydrolase activator NlpD